MKQIIPKVGVPAFAVVLIIALAAWHLWPGGAQTGSADSDRIKEGQPDPPGESVDKFSEVPSALSRTGSVAMEQPHSEPPQVDTSQAISSAEEQLVDASARHLQDILKATRHIKRPALDLTPEGMQKALENDSLQGVLRLRDGMNRCDKIPRNQDEFLLLNRYHLDRESSVFSWPLLAEVLLDAPEELDSNARQRWETTYESCVPFWTLRDSGLRERTRLLAEGGNTSARLLYASWTPGPVDQSYTFETVYLWQRKALDLTLLSLEEGEAAAFIAMRMSYAQGLFTRADQELALAWLLAYQLCGFDERDQLAEMVNLRMLRERGALMGTTYTKILSLAEPLLTFCAEKD